MSVSDQLAQQAAGLQQVADLKKQAMQNYGVEQGLFTGAKTAYATGKKQIAELIGQEKSQKLESIIPPAALAAKYAYKKYGGEEFVSGAKKAVGEGLESAGKKLSDAADSAGEAISGAAKQAGQRISQAFSSSAPDTVAARATGTAEEDEFPAAEGGETGSLAQGSGSQAVSGGARSAASTAGDDAASTAGRTAATAAEKEATETGASDFMAQMEAQGAKAAARVAATSAEEGTAIATESAIPGFGEIAMAFTALGMLIHGIHKEHKEELQEKAANIVPKAPDAPNLPTVNFDSAPVIDSSAFHAL